ncbi:unnamed protein product [Didymodactylos carnosus]|uniref:Uncharacterized protein n=1 Tax=Didymodactylos carnosus TaxID=1234261 RepID=A0A813SBE3_9BILA|nr:unnamed protein product [Didymodactylos carnosus]CAF0936704.1 unnamed protein product [Didymodactylos carnosus]CAF3579042.1 unnamed protein product [Didymodactylos carnosus]CAF3712263.1 unnamed protein product [Didymodactylos carnosus]
MSAIVSDTEKFQQQPNGLIYLPYNNIIDDNSFSDNTITDEISKLANIPIVIIKKNQNSNSYDSLETEIPSLPSNHSVSSITTNTNNNELSIHTSNSLGDLSCTPLLDIGQNVPLESVTPPPTTENHVQQSHSFPSTSSTSTTTTADSLSAPSSHSSSPDKKSTNCISIEPSLQMISVDQPYKQQQQEPPPVIKSKAPLPPPSSKRDIITQKPASQNSSDDYQQQQQCCLPSRSPYYDPQDETNELIYSCLETRITTPPCRGSINHRHGSADRLYYLEREQQPQSEYMNRSSSSAFYPLNYTNVRRTTTFSGGGTHHNQQQQQMVINGLEHELYLTKEQLNSTIRSIKTYWSPELKKERSIRKDEQLKRSKQTDNQEFHVQTLEIQVHQLHEELEQYRQHRCPSKGSTMQQPQHQDSSTANNQTSLIETLKNSEKNLKDKLDHFHNDLHGKENECTTLKAKVDTYESKERDLQHYITILKESIMIKDQQVTMVQSEVGDLRTRLKEKDSIIERKNVKIQSTRLERQQRDSDLIELKQQLDIKDRKINLLNRKIENLEEQVKDKVSQIASTRAKLTNTYQTHQNQLVNSTLVMNLEQTLQDKERQIEKLREQKHTLDVEHQDELEQMQKILNDSREKLEQKEKDYYEGQNQIIELKEQLNNTKSQLTRRELSLQTLEESLTDKYDEYKKRFEKEQQTRQQQQQQHSTQDQKDIDKLTLENRTLQELLRTCELEQNKSQREIEWMQLELTENKTKEENIEQQQEQDEHMRKKQQRIEELEEAVRESLQITTEREYAMAQQRRKLDNLEKQIKTLQTEVDRLREENHEQRHMLTQCQYELSQRKKDYEARIEDHIKQLDNAFISQYDIHVKLLDKDKLVLWFFYFRQEKLLGQLSEKDSEIADLEMDPQAHRVQINRLNGEKHQLHNQLKELTEIRMKIIQNHMAAKELDDKEYLLSHSQPYDADGISY